MGGYNGQISQRTTGPGVGMTNVPYRGSPPLGAFSPDPSRQEFFPRSEKCRNPPKEDTIKTTTERGYGWRYQKARRALLASNPMCHWCKVKPATTADHEPPMHVVGGPHLMLVPSCGPCNYGRRQKVRTSAPPSRDW